MRSSYKTPFIFKGLLKKNNKLSKKLYKKNSLLSFLNIGKKYLVYNGKKFFNFEVNNNCLKYNNKLGEFIFTRKLAKHKGKPKRSKKRKSFIKKRK